MEKAVILHSECGGMFPIIPSDIIEIIPTGRACSIKTKIVDSTIGLAESASEVAAIINAAKEVR